MKAIGKKEAAKAIEGLLEKGKQGSKDSVRKARRIAMKNRIKMPAAFKRQFCMHCYAYLSSSRRRIRNGKLIIYCLECKHFKRIPIK